MASEDEDDKIECILNVNKEQEICIINVYKENEHILNNKNESFKNKVKSMIEVWKSIGELTLSRFDPRHVIQIMDWAKLHALDIVLTAEWNAYRVEFQDQLLWEVEKAQNGLLKLNGGFATRCKKLADVVRNPWEDPILMKIMQSKNCEIGYQEVEFFCMETAYLVSVRLKKLCESQCEDLALNLAAAFIKCNKVAKIQNFDLNASETHMWFIFDIYIALLYKFQEKQEIVSSLKELSFEEGLKLIKRFSKKRIKIAKIWKNCQRVAILALQMYISRVVLKLTSDLTSVLKDYVSIYLSLCQTEELLQDFANAIRRISNLADASGLYIFSFVTQQKAGVQLKPFIIEMYIRGLTTDMNDLERRKDSNETQIVSNITTRLAKAFCNLGEFLNDHVKVARECILTAFSLEPTEERMKMIENLARRSGFHVLDTGRAWKCKSHPPALPSDDVMWQCPDCGDWMCKPQLKLTKINMALSEALQNSVLGISQALCDDLVVCLSNPRYQVLNWFLPWNDLQKICLLYLRDPQATKNFITELKFVDIDYTQFKDIKPEPIDDLNGIERGYEQYIDINMVTGEETDTSSEDSIPPYPHAFNLGIDDAEDTNSITTLPVQQKSDPVILKSLRMFRPNIKRKEKSGSDQATPKKVLKKDMNCSVNNTSLKLSVSRNLSDYLNSVQSQNISKSETGNSQVSEPKNAQSATLPQPCGQVAGNKLKSVQVHLQPLSLDLLKTIKTQKEPEVQVLTPCNQKNNIIADMKKKELKIELLNKPLLSGFKEGNSSSEINVQDIPSILNPKSPPIIKSPSNSNPISPTTAKINLRQLIIPIRDMFAQQEEQVTPFTLTLDHNQQNHDQEKVHPTQNHILEREVENLPSSILPKSIKTDEILFMPETIKYLNKEKKSQEPPRIRFSELCQLQEKRGKTVLNCHGLVQSTLVPTNNCPVTSTQIPSNKIHTLPEMENVSISNQKTMMDTQIYPQPQLANSLSTREMNDLQKYHTVPPPVPQINLSTHSVEVNNPPIIEQKMKADFQPQENLLKQNHLQKPTSLQPLRPTVTYQEVIQPIHEAKETQENCKAAPSLTHQVHLNTTQAEIKHLPIDEQKMKADVQQQKILPEQNQSQNPTVLQPLRPTVTYQEVIQPIHDTKEPQENCKAAPSLTHQVHLNTTQAEIKHLPIGEQKMKADVQQQKILPEQNQSQKPTALQPLRPTVTYQEVIQPIHDTKEPQENCKAASSLTHQVHLNTTQAEIKHLPISEQKMKANVQQQKILPEQNQSLEPMALQPLRPTVTYQEVIQPIHDTKEPQENCKAASSLTHQVHFNTTQAEIKHLPISEQKMKANVQQQKILPEQNQSLEPMALQPLRPTVTYQEVIQPIHDTKEPQENCKAAQSLTHQVHLNITQAEIKHLPISEQKMKADVQQQKILPEQNQSLEPMALQPLRPTVTYQEVIQPIHDTKEPQENCKAAPSLTHQVHLNTTQAGIKHLPISEQKMKADLQPQKILPEQNQSQKPTELQSLRPTVTYQKTIQPINETKQIQENFKAAPSLAHQVQLNTTQAEIKHLPISEQKMKSDVQPQKILPEQIQSRNPAVLKPLRPAVDYQEAIQPIHETKKIENCKAAQSVTHQAHLNTFQAQRKHPPTNEQKMKADHRLQKKLPEQIQSQELTVNTTLQLTEAIQPVHETKKIQENCMAAPSLTHQVHLNTSQAKMKNLPINEQKIKANVQPQKILAEQKQSQKPTALQSLRPTVASQEDIQPIHEIKNIQENSIAASSLIHQVNLNISQAEMKDLPTSEQKVVADVQPQNLLPVQNQSQNLTALQPLGPTGPCQGAIQPIRELKKVQENCKIAPNLTHEVHLNTSQAEMKNLSTSEQKMKADVQPQKILPEQNQSQKPTALQELIPPCSYQGIIHPVLKTTKCRDCFKIMKIDPLEKPTTTYQKKLFIEKLKANAFTYQDMICPKHATRKFLDRLHLESDQIEIPIEALEMPVNYGERKLLNEKRKKMIADIHNFFQSLDIQFQPVVVHHGKPVVNKKDFQRKDNMTEKQNDHKHVFLEKFKAQKEDSPIQEQEMKANVQSQHILPERNQSQKPVVLQTLKPTVPCHQTTPPIHEIKKLPERCETTLTQVPKINLTTSQAEVKHVPINKQILKANIQPHDILPEQNQSQKPIVVEPLSPTVCHHAAMTTVATQTEDTDWITLEADTKHLSISDQKMKASVQPQHILPEQNQSRTSTMLQPMRLTVAHQEIIQPIDETKKLQESCETNATRMHLITCEENQKSLSIREQVIENLPDPLPQIVASQEIHEKRKLQENNNTTASHNSDINFTSSPKVNVISQIVHPKSQACKLYTPIDKFLERTPGTSRFIRKRKKSQKSCNTSTIQMNLTSSNEDSDPEISSYAKTTESKQNVETHMPQEEHLNIDPVTRYVASPIPVIDLVDSDQEDVTPTSRRPDVHRSANIVAAPLVGGKLFQNTCKSPVQGASSPTKKNCLSQERESSNNCQQEKTEISCKSPVQGALSPTVKNCLSQERESSSKDCQQEKIEIPNRLPVQGPSSPPVLKNCLPQESESLNKVGQVEKTKIPSTSPVQGTLSPTVINCLSQERVSSDKDCHQRGKIGVLSNLLVQVVSSPPTMKNYLPQERGSRNKDCQQEKIEVPNKLQVHGASSSPIMKNCLPQESGSLNKVDQVEKTKVPSKSPVQGALSPTVKNCLSQKKESLNKDCQQEKIEIPSKLPVQGASSSPIVENCLLQEKEPFKKVRFRIRALSPPVRNCLTQRRVSSNKGCQEKITIPSKLPVESALISPMKSEQNHKDWLKLLATKLVNHNATLLKRNQKSASELTLHRGPMEFCDYIIPQIFEKILQDQKKQKLLNRANKTKSRNIPPARSSGVNGETKHSEIRQKKNKTPRVRQQNLISRNDSKRPGLYNIKTEGTATPKLKRKYNVPQKNHPPSKHAMKLRSLPCDPCDPIHKKKRIDSSTCDPCDPCDPIHKKQRIDSSTSLKSSVTYNPPQLEISKCHDKWWRIDKLIDTQKVFHDPIEIPAEPNSEEQFPEALQSSGTPICLFWDNIFQPENQLDACEVCEFSLNSEIDTIEEVSSNPNLTPNIRTYSRKVCNDNVTNKESQRGGRKAKLQKIHEQKSRRVLKVVLRRMNMPEMLGQSPSYQDNSNAKTKCDKGKSPQKYFIKQKSYDESENEKGQSPNITQARRISPLQHNNQIVDSKKNYKSCCDLKTSSKEDSKEGDLRHPMDRRFVQSVLANVPGLNDLEMLRPSEVNPIVNVVQVSVSRTTQNIAIQNTSTQVTPHIQRIGQPRLGDQKPDPISTSPSSGVATIPTSTPANTKNHTSQPSTLINILSQQVIGTTGPAVTQNNTVRRQAPVINILSQQIIRPSQTAQKSSGSNISTTTPTTEVASQISQIKSVVTSAITSETSNVTTIKTTTAGVKSVSSVATGTGSTILQFICKSSLPKFQQAFGKTVYHSNKEVVNCSTHNIDSNNSHGEIKKTMSKAVPVNLQPLQGSVIYSRQVPVGQTISLIPPGGTARQVFRIATSNPDQISLVKDSAIHSRMSALLAAALQNRPKNTEDLQINCDETTKVTLTRPALVQNARIVKPVQLQLPTNVRSTPQTNLSSTTLEQLREFDMVYKQIKERGSSTTTEGNVGTSENQEAPPQRISVTYVNQLPKYTQLSPVVVVTSYGSLQPAASPALSVTSQGSSSPCLTSTSNPTLPKISTTKSSKGKTLKSTTNNNTAKSSPIPKPQQKPQEDEHTTQRIFDILAEYAEQLRNSPDLNNKPAPRRRSNPPTNPSQSSKRKKSSGAKKSGQSTNSIDIDTDDVTVGSEDSSGGGIIQLSVTDDEQSQAATTVTTSDSNENSNPSSTRPIILNENALGSQPRNVIIADSTVGEALKMPNTAVIVPGSYIMPVSMVKGGQQIAVVSGGSKILATVPARSGQNMLLFQSFTNQNRKGAISAVKYSTVQPISGISSQSLAGVSAQPPVILPSNSVATAVALGQPITLKKVEERDANEIVLTISPPKEEPKPIAGVTQMDGTINVRNDSVDIKGGDIKAEDIKVDKCNVPPDNSNEKNFQTYQKSVITNSTGTSVIATCLNVKTEEGNDTQSIVNHNLASENVKSESKPNTRIQSVLVTACTSNGPMFSHATHRYKKGEMGRTNQPDQTNKEFVHNGEKTNNNDSKTYRSNANYYTNKAKKACIESLKADSDIQKQAVIERELRLQKSLSEECEDLGVDEPSTSDLFPEADLLFDSNHSPSFDQTSQDIIKRSQSGEMKEVKHLFSDDETSNSLRSDLFEYVEYHTVDAGLEYQAGKMINNGNVNSNESGSSGCEDNTLLPKSTAISDVTLNSPISPETYQESSLNKYKFKYSNKKKCERIKAADFTEIEPSSEEITGNSEMNKVNCEDDNLKLLHLALNKNEDCVKEGNQCELHCGDGDQDSPSGRGARRSVRKLCSCCNGSQDSNISKKRPHSSRPPTPSPHKKAFLGKKR